jgi:hypothetical protein
VGGSDKVNEAYGELLGCSRYRPQQGVQMQVSPSTSSPSSSPSPSPIPIKTPALPALGTTRWGGLTRKCSSSCRCGVGWVLTLILVCSNGEFGGSTQEDHGLLERFRGEYLDSSLCGTRSGFGSACCPADLGLTTGRRGNGQVVIDMRNEDRLEDSLLFAFISSLEAESG